MFFELEIQTCNPLTPQWMERFSVIYVLLLVFGKAVGHKPLHTLRLHIDIFFGAMKLVKHAIERGEATASEEAWLDWSVMTVLSARSFLQSDFLFQKVMFVREIHALYLLAQVFRTSTHKRTLGPEIILYFES